MQTERRVAVNPQTKPTDLGCESADRLLSSADTIAIYYYYSARKLILTGTFIIFSFIVLYFTVRLLLLINEFLFCSVLILPSHGGWKAEST